MTHDEVNLLIERAAGDHVFRQKLLMEPQHTAAELDITISDNESGEILRSADEARNRCLSFDRLRDRDRRVFLLMKVAGGTRRSTIQ